MTVRTELRLHRAKFSFGQSAGRPLAAAPAGVCVRMAGACYRVPAGPDLLCTVTAVVPLQLLAYYVATAKGMDVDKPRNLAKTVTVE